MASTTLWILLFLLAVKAEQICVRWTLYKCERPWCEAGTFSKEKYGYLAMPKGHEEVTAFQEGLASLNLHFRCHRCAFLNLIKHGSQCVDGMSLSPIKESNCYTVLKTQNENRGGGKICKNNGQNQKVIPIECDDKKYFFCQTKVHGSLCNGSFASGNGSFDYELKVEQGCSTTKPTPIVPFTNTMTNEKMNNEKSITVPLAKASSDQTTESDTTTTSSITSEDSSHTTYFSTMTSTEGGQISSSTETFAETSELSTVLTTTQKMAETNNPPSYTQTAENISTIELCVCSCSPGLLKDNPAEFEKLLSELRVQPNETSRARRRRASMMDQRLTAAAVGVVAWACLMASLTWFVVADAFAFFKNVRKAIRRSWQKKRETSQA